MSKDKNILSASAMEKLLKKSGAERVSESAKMKMVEVLESYAVYIGEKAVRLAKHAGRKTVKGVDVSEARHHH